MYSFRKDFDDRREEAVKEITGYEELTAFLERSTNLSQYTKAPSDFIGECIVTLTIQQKKNERLEAKWNGRHENGETTVNREDFTNECNAEDFKKIIIYILRRDNLDFKIVVDSEDSEGSTFLVYFKV